nr:lysine-specific histone demethylase 1 homolog 3-like isoform X1 [Tanacetum cinerariifolium]
MGSKILVVRSHADNLGYQCDWWTIKWLKYQFWELVLLCQKSKTRRSAKQFRNFSLCRSHKSKRVSQFSFDKTYSFIIGTLKLGESACVDSSIFTKAWVNSAGSKGLKGHSVIDRWQSQATAADSDFFNRLHVIDEEDLNINLKRSIRRHDGLANESLAPYVNVNREMVCSQSGGVDNIKQSVVNYVPFLLMLLYKARKNDKESYKQIIKKTATKVNHLSVYYTSF